MTDTLKTHSVKIQITTILIVLSFVIGTTVSMMNTKSELDIKITTLSNQYEHTLKWYKTLSEKQEVLSAEDQKQDLVIMEIKTKLMSIEGMLIDIKRDLDK